MFEATVRHIPLNTRVEQNGSGVTYSGAWSPNTLAVHSGGSAVLAVDAGTRVTFAFNGTGATWIAYRDAWSGIARVYVDGALTDSIDTYSSGDKPQASMYTISGLTSGSHSLTIEVTGTKSGASGGAWIWVDAFEVTTADSSLYRIAAFPFFRIYSIDEAISESLNRVTDHTNNVTGKTPVSSQLPPF